MGQLVDGIWHAGWYEPDDKGAYPRPKTQCRAKITSAGSTPHAAVPGREHLYATSACPWRM